MIQKQTRSLKNFLTNKLRCQYFVLACLTIFLAQVVLNLLAVPYGYGVHVQADLLKPLYSLGCPKINYGEDSSILSRSLLPKIFMIHGRSKSEQPEESIKSWSSLPSNLSFEIYSTEPLTNSFRYVRDCPNPTKWATRLFRIYQAVFRDILDRFPQDPTFVFVEDDTRLSDFGSFQAETVFAQNHRLGFYSYFTSKDQGNGCIYEFGTPGFHITRQFMMEIIAVSPPVLCRLPIDMYIASRGPWYASTRQTIQHLGDGRRFQPFSIRRPVPIALSKTNHSHPG